MWVISANLAKPQQMHGSKCTTCWDLIAMCSYTYSLQLRGRVLLSRIYTFGILLKADLVVPPISWRLHGRRHTFGTCCISRAAGMAENWQKLLSSVFNQFDESLLDASCRPWEHPDRPLKSCISTESAALKV